MLDLSCPLSWPAKDRILLAHGGGGRLTSQLIEDVFLPAFSNTARILAMMELDSRPVARVSR